MTLLQQAVHVPRENQAVVNKPADLDKKMVILIRGLPSSGKTTMANAVAGLLQAPQVNADDVRTHISTDLGFTSKDRIIQANRMAHIALLVASGRNSTVVVDFVCPTQETFDMFEQKVLASGANLFVVWLNTIQESPFENTNNIFDRYVPYNMQINRFTNDAEEIQRLAKQIADEVKVACNTREYVLRYNTLCGDSDLRWRIIDVVTKEERLAASFCTHGALTVPQSTVEHGVTKWNVGINANAVWTGNHVDFY